MKKILLSLLTATSLFTMVSIDTIKEKNEEIQRLEAENQYMDWEIQEVISHMEEDNNSIFDEEINHLMEIIAKN